MITYQNRPYQLQIRSPVLLQAYVLFMSVCICFQSWSFWFTDDNKSAANYEDRVHEIRKFSTMEEFWSIYSHMKRLGQLPIGSDYHLFSEGVRPMWEDPENKVGGKWLIRLKKNVIQILWERLLLAVVGNQFAEDDAITGCVASVRGGEDVISVWNKNARDNEAKERIREMLIQVLKIPKDTLMEYREHDASLHHLKDNIKQ